MTYETTKQTRETRRANGQCRECGRRSVNGGAFCTKHRDANRLSSRRAHLQLKLNALNAYGGALCACCGEKHVEFLTIDHVNGDGARHRRKIFGRGRAGGGSNFYNWLKRNSYPPGFRVLCYNCNCARGAFGYCPHTAKQRTKVK